MAVGGGRIQESEKTAISVSRRFYMDDSVPNATWFRGAGYENPCLSGFLYPSAWNTLTLGTESEKNVLDGNRAEMYGEVPEGGRVSE